MLAKLTSKNQLTLPKSVTDQLGPVQYFEVKLQAGQVVLTPVRIQRGDAVRAKLAELELDEGLLDDALNWAQQAGDRRVRATAAKRSGKATVASGALGSTVASAAASTAAVKRTSKVAAASEMATAPVKAGRGGVKAAGTKRGSKAAKLAAKPAVPPAPKAARTKDRKVSKTAAASIDDSVVSAGASDVAMSTSMQQPKASAATKRRAR
ncbi:AbrB/MazE/SpoVT family DNA-binding domain-containing protein [Roseateles amylovorans]|uniref:AbrB/MazE/SpoVT family DNA-binding domain-containing protein n=1 Tax=Roseateles amylovorans TaxID=2978473 RepID=A0ABY6B0I1_9BURK|nr:AbrB/MazE/SpoVT family DNA-binding domain-containing protein [Roseateles amylovorans]UXH78452.1 AbrB/MazE/SpoVT family DNA-binding domain-containing protein [Roseateles amylovorans]